MFRRLSIVALVLIALAGGLYLFARAEARRDPVVRTATIRLPGWPAGARPVRAVLISDIHIGSPAMDEARLARIVGQTAALKPDLVLLAGDYIFGQVPRSARTLGAGLVRPLAALHARLGVVAVLGNHDYWTGAVAVRAALSRAGVTVLENQATVRGPLAIGGIGDDFTHHDDVAATIAAVRRLPGARMLLTHSPDLAPGLPTDMPLLLAGHTHCGQVVIPLYGPVASVSRYGARYICGVRREPGRTVVVTAGVGTSGPPLRMFAPPDLWLLTLGP